MDAEKQNGKTTSGEKKTKNEHAIDEWGWRANRTKKRDRALRNRHIYYEIGIKRGYKGGNGVNGCVELCGKRNQIGTSERAGNRYVKQGAEGKKTNEL